MTKFYQIGVIIPVSCARDTANQFVILISLSIVFLNIQFSCHQLKASITHQNPTISPLPTFRCAIFTLLLHVLFVCVYMNVYMFAHAFCRYLRVSCMLLLFFFTQSIRVNFYEVCNDIKGFNVCHRLRITDRNRIIFHIVRLQRLLKYLSSSFILLFYFSLKRFCISLSHFIFTVSSLPFFFQFPSISLSLFVLLLFFYITFLCLRKCLYNRLLHFTAYKTLE